MNAQKLVAEWFDKWTTGDFHNLPISEDFSHSSPFGSIEGKDAYLKLVKENTDKFLGQTFELHDTLYTEQTACVRYTARQGNDFSLDVSEWYYFKNDLIHRVVAYYHIGDIREERKLSS